MEKIDPILRPYIAFYRGKSTDVFASSSYEAQQLAAKKFGAKRHYDVSVALADVEHSTGSL